MYDNPEIENIMNLIRDYLWNIRMLKEQPEKNQKAIDIIMLKIISHTKHLNDVLEEEYKLKLEIIENIETVTIRDELIKRERILELAKEKADVFKGLFDQSNIEEQQIYDLVQSINGEKSYDQNWREAEYNLVLEQLELIDQNKKKEQLLKEEYEQNARQIGNYRHNTKNFEDFNKELSANYERFITMNEIDKINPEQVINDKIQVLEQYYVALNNMRLLESIQSVDTRQYEFLQASVVKHNRVIDHLNQQLFLVQLASKIYKKVNNYEELQSKLEDIVKFVIEKETELISNNENGLHPNKISYRTIFFMNDLKTIKNQLNADINIEQLQHRNKEIEKEIDVLYDNVKGLRELKEIFKGETNSIDAKEELAAIEVSSQEVEPETLLVEVNEPQEIIIGKIDEEINLEEDDEVLTVIQTQRASNNLLLKIQSVSAKLKKLAQKSAIMIVAGAIILSPFIVSEAKSSGSKNTPILSQVEVVESLSIVDQMIDNSVGDKISISDGTKYYRDATAAQLNKDSFETGKGDYSLKADNYNINRIALMEKDVNGNATGKILAVNVTPGVKASELAKAMGINDDQYDVMIHINKGDKDGNYFEAPLNSGVKGDLCWLNADDNGIKLVVPANELLKSSGKGIKH